MLRKLNEVIHSAWQISDELILAVITNDTKRNGLAFVKFAILRRGCECVKSQLQQE